jgi:hypothetical protein
MALKGNLHDFTITQLFNLVSLAAKTGVLVVETKAHNARVFFKDGKLVFKVIGADICSSRHKVIQNKPYYLNP